MKLKIFLFIITFLTSSLRASSKPSQSVKISTDTATIIHLKFASGAEFSAHVSPHKPVIFDSNTGDAYAILTHICLKKNLTDIITTQASWNNMYELYLNDKELPWIKEIK